MLFGVSPLVYWQLMFSREATILVLAPLEQTTEEGAFRKHQILGEAHLTICDRIELGFGLLVSHVLSPVIFGPACFEPNFGLQLGHREILVSFECWGLGAYDRGTRDALWHANIAPVGKYFWQDVTRRHQLKLVLPP